MTINGDKEGMERRRSQQREVGREGWSKESWFLWAPQSGVPKVRAQWREGGVDWIASPKICIEAVTLNMTVFRDGAFKKVMRFQWGHQVGPNLIWLMSLQKEEETPWMHTQRKEMWGHSKKMAVYRPGRETELANTFILDHPASKTVSK